MLKFRQLIVLLILVGINSTIKAQSEYDLLNFSRQEPQGTARFSGMGGAFNAVGGDFSTLSTNPAGIGLYRSSEFTFTPTLGVNRTRTDYLGDRVTDSRTRMGIANLGFIGNYFTGQNEGLISISYGIGYNKLADFNRRSYARGVSGLSVLDEYVNEARLGSNHDFVYGALEEVNLIHPIEINGVDDYTTSPSLEEGDLVEKHRIVDQIGNMGEFVLSVGGNVSNKLYFGVTLGMQDMRMDKRIDYDEYAIEGNNGTLIDAFRTEVINTTGFGINGKFGVIYRATDEFRIGATIHTPTFYYMREEYLLDMESFFNNNADYGWYPDMNISEYRMQSPYRIGFGLAYTFGKRGMISVDYELTGYNGLRMRNRDNVVFERGINQAIRDQFRNTSTVRIGAEINAVGGLLFRGGFNYAQSPYKENFGSNFNEFLYAGGIGYRNGGLILDLAYTHSIRYYSYYPDTVFETRAGRSDNTAAHEKNTRGIFLLTLGFKF